MKRKVFGSLVIFGLLGLMAFGVIGSGALFTDTETSTGNIFTAGSLDLKVDGGDTPVVGKFSADNMKPGSVYNGGCVSLRNAGTLPGVLSVKVTNLVSNENGRLEPEISDGDPPGAEYDPTGYDANSGNGELWDQITVKFCLDDGLGAHTGNGQCDWDDTIIKSFSSTQDDYSAVYSIALDTDLAASLSYVLGAGASVDFCVAVKFIDDLSSSWWGGQGSLTNNMAMSDDAQLDFVFGVVQAP